ncbi:MAG: KamA family radical SAM protein [Thermodesulfobacteriota bacterium]|jgi:lysine 2,3-aminomutase
MELWQKILNSSFRQPAQLAKYFRGIDVASLDRVAETYPMCINPYYLSLVERPDDPIGRQCIPDPEELEASASVPDPLAEESTSPVPCLVHRYPDRALFLVTTRCAMYCRFCTRKRKVGKQDEPITEEMRRDAIAYIARTPEIRDVIVSGGDPLLLPDETLEGLLQSLRAIPHVEMVRIGTRVPCVLPQRVTRKLADMLKKYHPLYMNVHFEHPREVTPQAAKALNRLADAGIPLGNQSVLLKGVNDDPATFVELNRKLLACRVRPYYIYQADPVEGTEHFRTPVDAGLAVVRGLRGHTSGLAVPQYVIDAPGGGGKIPLLPEYVVARDGERVLLRNYKDQYYVYPEVDQTPAVPPLAARCPLSLDPDPDPDPVGRVQA